MSPKRTCPDCGSTLPDDAPRGLCPECLMGAALPRASTGRSAATNAFEPAESSVLATIARSIGPVPSVLLRDTAPGEEPGPIVKAPGHDDNDRSIRYRIDGEIARGGMGAVLKGRDPDLGRDVALKVLRDDLRDNADMVRRFVEEAQIGGQLQHPGVVPIYELGTFADRRPFFAMKLVRGHTLAQLLDGRTDHADDRPRFLSIFEAIAQTVAYAHARGVIHRDLKPSNVMVGSFGEVQVMDWGLAKVLPRGGVVDDEKAGKAEQQETVIATARSGPDSSGLSHAGSVMGTPAYMGPEQARGEIEHVDEPADVFALGSILCEILSGEPAFLGRSSAQILRKAALGDTATALARLDACAADAELIALAADCLAREPEDRPRQASAVAERVTAYLAGVQDRLRAAEIAGAAESARAEEAIVRARAERRARHFQVGLAASLLVLTTAGGLTFTYWLQQRQHQAARFAQVLAETKALRDKARRDADDPTAWRDALAALERAESQGPAGQVKDLRDEIRAGLDEAERDARLRQAIVEIRANQEDVGPDGTDAAYATAFHAAEMDLDALEPAELARRLSRRREAVVIELSAFLDDWSAVRRAAHRPVAAWRKPLEAARLADPDPYRDQIRKALLAEDRRREAAALKALAAAPEAAGLPAPTAVLMGRALAESGEAEAAVGLLRPAAFRHPGDVWVNHALAGALDKLGLPNREEAVRYYTAARALRPETAHDLAHLLERMGRGTEAEAVFRDLANRRPKNAHHLMCLSVHAKQDGRATEAATIFERAATAAREAIRLKRDDFAAHSTIGLGLNAVKGDYTGAEVEFREAIWLRPDDARSHTNLGLVLYLQGKVSEAIVAYLEAIRLRPDSVAAHVNLGNALGGQGKLSEAIAAYREAIRLRPDAVAAHVGLGNALSGQGKLSEAIAAYREAIRLKPDDAITYWNLSLVLQTSGDLPGAVAASREAIRLKFEPEAAEAHCNLGSALRQLGQYAESLAEFRLGHELGSKRADWHYPSAEWVAEAERLATTADRLPAILGRTTKPDKDADALLKRPEMPSATGAKPSGAGPVAPVGPSAMPKPAEPKPGTPPETAEALDPIHKRAHELASSKPAEAESLFRQALEGYRKILGPEAALTLDLTLDLANLLSRFGRGAEAEPLSRAALGPLRQRFGPTDPRVAPALASLGLSLIQQEKWTEAEPVLRECLAIREKNQLEEWSTFNTRSTLGASLLGQKKYAEAEPLIVSGYEGLKAREAKIPPLAKPRLSEAAERVLKLYQAWDKPDKAAEWKAKLAKPTGEAGKQP